MRILLALDGSAQSELATRFARRLACELRAASIVAVHVYTEGNDDEARSRIAPAVALLDEEEIDYQVETGPGDPAELIVARAQEHECDVIVMGARGLGAISGKLLGSVSTKVAQQASVPVTLVK